MTATVSILVAHRDAALKISNAALRFRLPENKDAGAAPSPSPSPSATAAARLPGGEKKPRRKSERTVYVLRDGKPQPVQIKVGISDGVFTEVLEGLKEGDPVITGVSSSGASAQQQASNPFGGGFPGGMRR
jgi:HlyD family secretion protein